MSLPTTGTIRARALGFNLTFDGQIWTGAPAQLLTLLNRQTAALTHVNAEETARRTLAAIFSDWEIVSSFLDEWDAPLPAGHED